MNVKMLKFLVDLALPNKGGGDCATVKNPDDFFEFYPRSNAVMNDLHALAPVYVTLYETADSVEIGVNKAAFDYFKL